MSDKVQEVSIRRVPMSFDLAVSIQRVLTGRITFESKFLERCPKNAIDDSESSENRMEASEEFRGDPRGSATLMFAIVYHSILFTLLLLQVIIE